MLGPTCALVHRTLRGFRSIEREHAAALQKCAFGESQDHDWLFRQSQRIAEALDRGEVALAQIYGLRIAIVILDDRQLAGISRLDFVKAYDPDERRIPKGEPHGGEWTTDGSAESGDGGQDGDSEHSSKPEDGIPSSAPVLATIGDYGDGGEPPPTGEPPITIKWPDQAPSLISSPAEPSATDGGPVTLGSPDLGDAAPNADNQSPQESSTASSEPDLVGISPANIPTAPPASTQQVNAILRAIAVWLARAYAILGIAFELDPRIRMLMAAIEAASWLAGYAPKIFSYLDDPKTLAELQDAATRPALDEIHHIVEAQKGSDNLRSNARSFPDLIDSPGNLVRVPYWKHVEITSWYSTKNERYGGLTPRQYLRGKTWDEQYVLGLQILRDIGVPK